MSAFNFVCNRICLVVLCTVLLASCAGEKAMPTLHGITLVNEGPSIYNYRAFYGEVSMPNDVESDPEFVGKSTSSAILDIPVPPTATVSWETPSHQIVNYSVPVRRFVPKPNEFRGVVYLVSRVGGVDVYVADSMKSDLTTARKVYSTK